MYVQGLSIEHSFAPKVVRSSVIFQREPAKLCQDEPATTSSAQFISTSNADKPPQKCGKARSRLLSSKLSEGEARTMYREVYWIFRGIFDSSLIVTYKVVGLYSFS